MSATSSHEHVIPLRTYFAVYAALLVLTVLTVGVSYANLGAVAIYAAMGVAIVKGSLVVGYFMHLKYDARFNALVFLVSLLFLVLFFSLTMVDLASRDRISEAEGNFVLREDRAAASAKLNMPPAPATSASSTDPDASSSAPASSSAAPALSAAPPSSSTGVK